MHEQLPSPSPSPSPSPASNSWLSPSSSNSSSVASSHMTCCGTHDAGPRSDFYSIPLTGKIAVPNLAVGSARDSSNLSLDPYGRLEPLNEAAIDYVSYPPYPLEDSDGGLCPELGDFVDSGYPCFQNEPIPHDLNMYEVAATLLPECHCSYMNKQYSIMSTPRSFEYDAAQANGSYNPHGRGLTYDVMSVTGVGLLPERISCVHDGCLQTFTRTADLDRHVLNVHNRVGHHCQVQGCDNNKGNGYCRPDKLKEHMWKKHGRVADLSYTKAVPSFGLFE